MITTHTRTRKILVAATAIASALVLAGCNPNESKSAFEVDLPDGGTVVCVSSEYNSSAGVSCDWDHADRGQA